MTALYTPPVRGAHTHQTDDDVRKQLYYESVENHQGCWIWTKAIHHSGYGIKQWKGKQWRVHQLSYHLFIGQIEKGLVVRHLCGNRACCNPLHLSSGTHSQNSIDAVVHGSYDSYLSEQEVYEIRTKYRTELYQIKDLAEEYDVQDDGILKAIRGDNYSCFTKVPPFNWRELDCYTFQGKLTNKGIQHVITEVVMNGRSKSDVAQEINIPAKNLSFYIRKYKDKFNGTSW